MNAKTSAKNEVPHVENVVAEHIDITPVYKKVTRSGKSISLSVTRIIPQTWKIIEIVPTQPVDGKMVLNIRRVV